MAQADRPAGRGANPANFVNRIVKDPLQPPDAIVLSGYLGSSSEPGHTRVYFDLQLSSFVEIPDDAILHVEETATGDSPLGVSYVWIKRDATLVHGRPGPERVRAKFLEGPIAQMGAGMGGEAVGAPMLPLTVGPPCGGTYLAALCPTHLPACGPTPLIHCATPGHPQCPTFLCTQLPACGPTPLQPCATPGHPVCPTPVCTHPPGCGPTPFHPCQTPGHPVCPTPACTHIAPCGTTAFHPCPTFGHPFCPVQTAFCPVQSAVCPVQTLACPVQTAVCPVQTLACPFPTAGCPYGPGGGGFNPGG
jgi:hypothetical protein